MPTNIYALGERLAKNHRKISSDLAYKKEHDPEVYNIILGGLSEEEFIKGKQMNELDNIRLAFKYSAIVSKIYEEEYGKIRNWYYLTVSPMPGVEFDKLKEATLKFINREFIIKYAVVFEQRGKDLESIGEGFHMHGIFGVKVTHCHNKTHFVKYAQSTFNKVCAGNGVDVEITKNPEEMFINYNIKYIAKDGHKTLTEETDAIWRQQKNIERYYTNMEDLPEKIEESKEALTLTSPGTVRAIIKGPEKIVW